jgi:hypothetical protein
LFPLANPFVHALMRLLSLLCACLEKKFRGGRRAAAEEADDAPAESWDLFFELRTLQAATNFFSELNQLGHGGFGPVYKVRFVNSASLAGFVIDSSTRSDQGRVFGCGLDGENYWNVEISPVVCLNFGRKLACRRC